MNSESQQTKGKPKLTDATADEQTNKAKNVQEYTMPSGARQHQALKNPATAYDQKQPKEILEQHGKKSHSAESPMKNTGVEDAHVDSNNGRFAFIEVEQEKIHGSRIRFLKIPISFLGVAVVIQIFILCAVIPYFWNRYSRRP